MSEQIENTGEAGMGERLKRNLVDSGFVEQRAPVALDGFSDVIVRDGVEIAFSEQDGGGVSCELGVSVFSDQQRDLWGYSIMPAGGFFRSRLSFAAVTQFESAWYQIDYSIEVGRRIMNYARCHDDMKIVESDGCKSSIEGVDNIYFGLGGGVVAGLAFGVEGLAKAGEVAGLDVREFFDQHLSLAHTPEALQDLWHRFLTMPVYAVICVFVVAAVAAVMKERNV